MPYNINSGYGAISAHSVTNSGGPMGKTFHVCRAGTNTYAYLSALYPVDSDGVVRVYAADGTADEVDIQAAIDACKGGRNDYVFVYPGTYNLTAALTLVGKSSVHLIGVNGGGMDRGTPGAAILNAYLLSSAENIIANSFCEISGFQFQNASGYSAITMGAGIGWVNIHHNLFKMVGSAGVTSGVQATAASAASYSRIHHNVFIHWAGTAAQAAIRIGLVGAPTTGVTISDNDIIVFGSVVYDYGIMHHSQGGMTCNNYVTDSGGASALYGGTITQGISFNVGATVIGNRLGMTAGTAFEGGTAGLSFIDNVGSGSGAILATNLET